MENTVVSPLSLLPPWKKAWFGDAGALEAEGPGASGLGFKASRVNIGA